MHKMIEFCRAFIAGSMACFLTACVAGSLIEV